MIHHSACTLARESAHPHEQSYELEPAKNARRRTAGRYRVSTLWKNLQTVFHGMENAAIPYSRCESMMAFIRFGSGMPWATISMPPCPALAMATVPVLKMR